jgi:hypothetical protein
VSCSQGPSVSRWQTGSEPGTVLACNEPFGRLSLRVYNARVFKGVLEIPGTTTVASRSLALTWLQNRLAYVTSRAVTDGSFEAEHAAYLLVYEPTE